MDSTIFDPGWKSWCSGGPITQLCHQLLAGIIRVKKLMGLQTPGRIAHKINQSTEGSRASTRHSRWNGGGDARHGKTRTNTTFPLSSRPAPWGSHVTEHP